MLTEPGFWILFGLAGFMEGLYTGRGQKVTGEDVRTLNWVISSPKLCYEVCCASQSSWGCLCKVSCLGFCAGVQLKPGVELDVEMELAQCARPLHDYLPKPIPKASECTMDSWTAKVRQKKSWPKTISKSLQLGCGLNAASTSADERPMQVRYRLTGAKSSSSTDLSAVKALSGLGKLLAASKGRVWGLFGKPVACNYRQISLNCGLLWGMAVCCFRLPGFPGWNRA